MWKLTVVLLDKTSISVPTSDREAANVRVVDIGHNGFTTSLPNGKEGFKYYPPTAIDYITAEAVEEKPHGKAK